MRRDKMVRNTKKKLAIFVGTSKCLIYAEAKFCASEIRGEKKYYECSRTEHCCALGCCVSPVLHFHDLWYYWILVVIMFLVCSGGGWWYRYWLQGRYRAAASAIPNRSSNSRPQSSLRGAACQGQRARITYNSARNTVLLHRMWKGPQRNGVPSPAYNGSATTSTHYQNMNVVLNDVNCPYYQLYGPPPSYETVIAQSRGKISNPASPEFTNARLNLQSTIAAPNPIVPPQCFAYPCNPSTRPNNGLDQSVPYSSGNASPRQFDNHEGGIPFPHFPQYCVANGTIRQNVCPPFEYQEQTFVPGDAFNRAYQGNPTNYVPYPADKSSDTSDPENQSYELPNTERYTMSSINCTAGSSRDGNPWEPNDRLITDVHGKAERLPGGRIDKGRGKQKEGTSEEAAVFGSAIGNRANRTNESRSTATSPESFEPEFARERRRRYEGSLKAPGRYAGNARCEEYSVQRAFSKSSPRSCEGMINSDRATASENTSRNVSPLEHTANAGARPFQSNPSNNVILESFVSGDASPTSTGNAASAAARRPHITNGSTNSDLESKPRLDRSKSLD